jgi:hypothetical protein
MREVAAYAIEAMEATAKVVNILEAIHEALWVAWAFEKWTRVELDSL